MPTSCRLAAPPLRPLVMLPSKAERILSRYRPIAPKPVPVPPSTGSFGTSNPSFTCASLVSFTSSSAKCKRQRKRRAQDSSSSKGAKAPNPIRSGASSLTQGPSDGTVPPVDFKPAKGVSHSNRVYGMEQGAEMSNGTWDSPALLDARFTSSGTRQLYMAEGASVVQQQGASMNGVTNALHHQQFSVLHQRLSTVAYNPSGSGPVVKDIGFMERAAAATATLLTDRSMAVSACDGKVMSYVEGGFTEMMQGVTRLPSAADVQSLMQARASPSSVIGQVALCASSAGTFDSPMDGHELQLRRPEHCPPPATLPQSMMAKSASHAQVEEECQSNAELVTLALLPTSPLRRCTTSELSALTLPSVAQPPSHHSSWHHDASHGYEHPDALPKNNTGACAAMVSGNPLLSTSMRRHIEVEWSMGSTSSVPIPNDAVIDKVYLEQVYGSSANPVLLVDDSNQVLWFNKPYDRALKSTSQQIFGNVVPTGPYIDPLGHPTPLGSFVLPVYGKPSTVRNATLWVFLKKLVTHGNESPVEQCSPGPIGRLHLGVGGSCQGRPPTFREAGDRASEATSVGHLRPTIVILESVTELHMGAPAAAESVEGAEARLGAGRELALITDCINRVSWANAALKQVVGHLGVESSNSRGRTPDDTLPDASSSDAPAFVICGGERVPHSAWAFSGRVNLEWMKGSKRRSMTLPCDVSRLAGSPRSPDINWLWKFDMAVSLSINSPC